MADPVTPIVNLIIDHIKPENLVAIKQALQEALTSVADASAMKFDAVKAAGDATPLEKLDLTILPEQLGNVYSKLAEKLGDSIKDIGIDQHWKILSAPTESVLSQAGSAISHGLKSIGQGLENIAGLLHTKQWINEPIGKLIANVFHQPELAQKAADIGNTYGTAALGVGAVHGLTQYGPKRAKQLTQLFSPAASSVGAAATKPNL